jgi:hypothetical protein
MDEQNAEKDTSLECTSTPGRSWPGASLCKSLKLGWHWRRLRWAVVAASEAAQGHEANGLPPGSREYQLLYRQVEDAMNNYCHAFGEDVELVKAKLPVISVLKRLATVPSPSPTSKKSLTLILASLTIVATALISFLIGFGEGIAHFIAHLLGA